MIIRSFCENDWQDLLSIYNRYLQHDQVDELFFVQYLLLNVNLDPAGIFMDLWVCICEDQIKYTQKCFISVKELFRCVDIIS